MSWYHFIIFANRIDRLDDIEDGSVLRRGKPAAHTVFGTSQTVNSATYLYSKATSELESLKNAECRQVFHGEYKPILHVDPLLTVDS